MNIVKDPQRDGTGPHGRGLGPGDGKGCEQGLADKMGITEDDVDAGELEAGINIEFEHTDDIEEAKQIALDHLAEIPDYYTRLKKMEDEAEKEEYSDLPENPYGVREYLSSMSNLYRTKESNMDIADPLELDIKKVGDNYHWIDKDTGADYGVGHPTTGQPAYKVKAYRDKNKESLSLSDYLNKASPVFRGERVAMSGEVSLQTAFSEARKYIKDPSQAPEGANVKRGAKGDYYYDTDGGGEVSPDDLDNLGEDEKQVISDKAQDILQDPDASDAKKKKAADVLDMVGGENDTGSEEPETDEIKSEFEGANSYDDILEVEMGLLDEIDEGNLSPKYEKPIRDYARALKLQDTEIHEKNPAGYPKELPYSGAIEQQLKDITNSSGYDGTPESFAKIANEKNIFDKDIDEDTAWKIMGYQAGEYN